MNHIYHSIWNEALGAWIAVSEIAKGQGKRSSNRRRKLLAASLLICTTSVWALPTGEQLVAGQATVNTPNAGQMQINQGSQNAILNWQGFSIAPSETVNIQQPNAQAALLNRVVGQDASQLQGQLNANGQVYVVNPNGVVFSKTAQVDVGGLIATTHTIQDADFMNGNHHFTQDGATGTVENHGTINTPEGGVVVLIGDTVTNTGSINTPKGTTILAAGQTVDLDFKGDGLIEVKVSEAALNAQITNKGAIQADGGRVVLTAKAAGQLIDTVINQEGIIRAQGLVERNGEIILDGGNNGVTQVSGTLDTDANASNVTGGKITVTGEQVQINNGATVTASGEAGGGTIVIGDKQTTSQTSIAQSANISANALDHGNAGTINVLANMDSGTVNVQGQLNASAPKNGNGGFIDTSAAHVKVADTAKISTKAANGNTGTWLIDPVDFTIAASGGDMTGAAVSTILVNTNFLIGTAVDDVNVNDAVTWSANQLTLFAGRNININTNLNGSGTAQLALQYGQRDSGNYFINNGAKVTLPAGANFSTQNGSTGAVKNYTVITSLGAAGSTSTTDLQGMNGGLGLNYALGADIDASATSTWNSGAGFEPVGKDAVTPFTGIFDGLGHTISNLNINRPATDLVGLFGIASSIMRNVGMEGGSTIGHSHVGGLVGFFSGSINNAYVTGSVSGTNNVGGLVGTVEGGTISNVYATGSVSGIDAVGGLVGISSVASISNAYATGSVTGDSRVGGLVGLNFGSSIDNVYATGSVTGTNNVGGLVSANFVASINNAYATGSVSGTNNVGGLVGLQGNSDNGGGISSISNSYATGRITGTSNIGGLVGIINNTGSVSVNNAFWDTQTTGQSNGVGTGSSAGVTGKTTAEMTQLATFTGWDISGTGGSTAIWRIYEGNTAPLLRSFLAPLTVTANNISKTYNGVSDSTLSSPVYYYPAGDSSGLVNAANPYRNAINVGSYTPTGIFSNQQGYDISLVNGVLTIDPATLTYTADAASRVYGVANPVFSGSVAGFVNGETLARATTGAVKFLSPADSTSNVGHYAIDGSGLVAINGNYLFKQATSNATALSITPAVVNEAIRTIIASLVTSVISNKPVITQFSTTDSIAGLISSVNSNNPMVTQLSSVSDTNTAASDLSVDDITDDFAGIDPTTSYCSSSSNKSSGCQQQDKSDETIVPTFNIKNSSGQVKRLLASGNKQFLSLLLADGSARVWDLESGMQRKIVSTDKNLALTHIGTVDETEHLLPLATKAGINTFDVMTSVADDSLFINQPNITHFVVSNDSSLLLVNTGANELSLWDSKQNKKLWQQHHDRGVVSNLALTDNKRYGAVLSSQPESYELLAGAAKFTNLIDAVDIVDLSTGKIIKSLPNMGEQVVYMQFKDNESLQVGLASGEVFDLPVAMGDKKTVANFAETVATVDNSKDAFAYTLKDGTVRVGDGLGHIKLSIHNGENPFQDAKLLDDGKKLLTVMQGGELSLWDVSSGKKMLRLFSTEQGWTVIDAFGRFDSSEEAMKNFSWLADEEDIPLDSFSENYYEPGLLTNVLQNQDYFNSNPNVVKQGITLPPRLTVQLADQQAGDKVAAQLDVYDRGGGIDKINIYHNGRLLNNEKIVSAEQKLTEHDTEHRVLTLNIMPSAGKNTLKVIASNNMGIENSSSELNFNGETKTYAPSSLRIVTVGIDQYSDSDLNLDYSVADAKSIGQAMQNRSNMTVHKGLYNENATKSKILAELKKLSQGVQQDVLVIYFAGHGIALGKEWYFLPYETKLQPAPEKIAESGITATELSDIFKDSKIQRIMLMVDSCYSGAGMDAFRKLQNGQRYFTRKMGRSLGITVVAAAEKNQKAFESKTLGHGLFTYLVTQDINETQAQSAHNIANAVVKTLPKFAKGEVNEHQDPVSYTSGSDFMLTDILKESSNDKASSNIVPASIPKKLAQ